MLNVHPIAQAQLFEMSSTTTTTTPTTTYPFTYTTFTNASPTEFPSVFSFGSAVGCASNSVSPDRPPQPSNYPIDRAVGLDGGCVISNAAEYNDHAFWDMYACCESGDWSAMGSPFTCTAFCRTKGGQNFQQLGECLSKRVDVVICSPPYDEIGKNTTDPDASSSGSVVASQSSASGTMSASASGSSSASASAIASKSTGAASAVGGVQGSSSKAGLVLFGIVALGSAAGMFL
jgi:hypothetical protein